MRTRAAGQVPAIRERRRLQALLFADLVGSTELLERLGDNAWRRVLDRHDERTSALVAMCGGHVVNRAGDGTAASFELASCAVACASWLHSAASDLDLRLRIGLHAGEVELRGREITGIAVHLSARVCAAARPGETLLTSTVADLVAGSAPPLDNRGVRTLKGISRPWRLFALAADREPHLALRQG